MTFSSFIEGVNLILSYPTILWVVAGIIIGIFVGSLPGLGASLGMAILLPLTLPMNALDALVLLIGIYSGAMYGGSIAAILLNAPGTSAAAATTFDGYPMSRQGQAVTALSISATASAFAGLFTITTLILISPILIGLVLAFGSPEYFMIAVLGLAMITVVARGSMVKGLLAGAFGLSLTTIGVAPMAVDPRYTFGYLPLYDGLSFVAVLIGLFAIGEMIKLAGEEGGIAKGEMEFTGSIVPGIKTVFQHPITFLKSAYIGMGIGSIPGAGSTVSNFVAYTEAARSASDTGTFGAGNPVGVVASEASNNGTVGGSVIPALAFGIPGSAATAVLIGGLLMHGLQPGPELFDPAGQLSLTYGFFFALLVGNLVILIFGLAMVTRLGYLTKINTDYIIPMIIILSFLGAFSLRTNWVDVGTIIILGMIGFYMKKYNYSIIAFVLGVVLGPIAEENLFRSLQISDGTFLIFVTQPISLILFIMTLFILFGPFIKSWYEQQ